MELSYFLNPISIMEPELYKRLTGFMVTPPPFIPLTGQSEQASYPSGQSPNMDGGSNFPAGLVGPKSEDV